MTTGFPAYQQQVPAGVWARLGGSIIDYLLLTLLYVAVVGLFASPHYLNFTSPLLFDYALSLIFNSSLVFYALPLIFINLCAMLLVGTFGGATPGKRAMGAYVLVFDGSLVGYRRSLLRELAKFPPLLVISAFMIVFRRDRLGLHDLISDTAVIMR